MIAVLHCWYMFGEHTVHHACDLVLSFEHLLPTACRRNCTSLLFRGKASALPQWKKRGHFHSRSTLQKLQQHAPEQSCRQLHDLSGPVPPILPLMTRRYVAICCCSCPRHSSSQPLRVEDLVGSSQARLDLFEPFNPCNLLDPQSTIRLILNILAGQ